MEETTSSTTQVVSEPTPDTVIETKPAETPAPVPALAATPTRTPGWFGIAILCVLVSVASSVATIVAYDSWYAQKLVAVDIKGYISDQRDKYIAGKLTDDELKRSFDKLEQVVTAIPKNKAVLMGDLVVRNVEVVKP
ncbi:MAG: hypothetical protein CVU53_07295 [Deltaproteobacteria bacterium HGW-Deltaproteobacteria-11]|nr:MAG: hypothetical protein CVU53_07295 [Deltaproteobacteria bacterium HGW-Deltaproteobacteria-11]